MSKIIKTDILNLPSSATLILWVLTMIATPVVLWTFGEVALQRMIVAGVLIQVVVVITILLTSSGWTNTLRIVLPILPLAWLAEYVGSHSDFPFGAYHYTGILQPQVGGVPLLIPLAWLMMLPPAWAVASLIVERDWAAGSWRGRATRALVAALAFTAWDLFLDPQMVTWNFWQWETPGLYFGIPLSNYAGWLLVSFIFSFLFIPREIPVLPLVIIYAITWILQTIGQFAFWNLPGPAVFGFLGMGSMLLWAYRSKKPVS